MAQTRLVGRPARIEVGEAEHRPGSSAGRQAFLLLQPAASCTFEQVRPSGSGSALRRFLGRRGVA